MRSVLGMAATALAAVAGLVASDSNRTVVPFFIGLMFLGALEAATVYPPFAGWRRSLARGAALLWLIAAVWVGVLLLMSVTVWHASGPPPVPDPIYLGLPAGLYQYLGLYAGVVLVIASAFGPDRWFTGSQERDVR